MQFPDAVALVERHDAFDQPDGSYLAHGFMSFSRDESGEWQIGYYDPDSDSITSYHIDGAHVSRAEPADVFKEQRSVPALDLEAIDLPGEEAKRIAYEQLSASHPQHPLMKTILLLQTIDGSPIYNFTLVTQTLHMYNVRVHATTGKVVHEKLEPLMNLRADQD